jgi:hypothetical protein
MKQGRANLDVKADRKVEPIPHAVCAEAVDQLGQSLAYKKIPIYEGRGLKAPMAGEESHPCGSQGKH